ncbi:hypothetical protein I7I51_06854 [Histoplasma capsulatum]|uniref:Uncharacterized protein n=1 Tax=Ajellomyces capsulatus TaxID=5037 RepID=A0A8A1MMZ5_AJECA|nr:hypothetical protein I7I51_06854 [Histoplasma capsulatum]
MLQDDAELRAAGEHDTQERTRWETEHSATGENAMVENTGVESEKVAQDRARALAQLQSRVEGRAAEQSTDSAQRESNTPTAVLSRPVTHFDLRGVIAGWRQRGSQLDAPGDSHGRTSPRHQRSKAAGIRKSQKKDKPTRQNADRAANRVAPIANELESGSNAEQLGHVDGLQSPEPPPVEHGAAAPAVKSTRPETRVEADRVRFDVPAENDELDRGPRPITHFNFRELDGLSLTDPGGDRTNVADREPWPPTVPLPTIGTEPERASSDGKVSITFHVYERNRWRVADVLTVHPSEPSVLERTVWGYKRRRMVVYDMHMRAVSVSSSFRAATSDGANALLLIPRETKAQMDQARPIEPPDTAAGLLRKRTRRKKG